MKKHLVKNLLCSSLLAFGVSSFSMAAEDTIKVGVLHSLSGSMAISESALKDTVLMLIDEQNQKGGVLGKKLEPVVVDPASNWPLFAEKARELLAKDKVAVTFGGWTSVSRKSVLPVYEELNGILFYPVQWEGQESSKNIFYTGATPNQQAIPAVDYLLAQGIQRFALLGTDYVYPRTTNKLLEAYLQTKGIDKKDIMVNYTPFSFSDWQSIVSDVKKFSAEGKKTAVISTINGDANVPFYKELANQNVTPEQLPVIAFSVGEQELSGIDTKPLVGHLAAWNYFQSVSTPENETFIQSWKRYKKDEKAVTNDPMEATYIGFNMWVKAVEKAGTTDSEAVQKALIGVEVPNLSGGMAKMLPSHDISKPVLIGEIQDDGQFAIVEQTDLVDGEAWSPLLPESKNLVADWSETVQCGAFDKVAKVCTTK
ncbi:urea ABC transporter substrate-binding protein [[Pasteurella] aerogenes]|nr:urea ABC transporter substrate-binding protein [[Pasteurella] aerogenes]MCU9997888.1 urea ABC transporter substrate-binding protein [[Pasteurella] aerogenes]UWZ92377.1 urea ABC transporter substrate-binding protein [[Pasteurella] aerogenes]